MINNKKRRLTLSKLRRYMGIGVLAVCVAALSASLVGSAGAASPPKSPTALRTRPAILLPIHITRIVPSDRVSFDISATGGHYAEVRGGTSPSFIFSGGWTQVTHPQTGRYCLNGLFVNGSQFNYPAVVSVASRAGGSPPAVTSVPGGLVQYDSFGQGCPGVGVSTYEIVP